MLFAGGLRRCVAVLTVVPRHANYVLVPNSPPYRLATNKSQVTMADKRGPPGQHGRAWIRQTQEQADQGERQHGHVAPPKVDPAVGVLARLTNCQKICRVNKGGLSAAHRPSATSQSDTRAQ